jgi:hypothetical protein
MARKRKSQITVSGEGAKHLRKNFRGKFRKGERKAGKKLIRQEITASHEKDHAA